ncbi:MAG: hypothetical protein KGI67_16275, partial [Pseudomonadota bacterium]|nr:hypothetical protein [Pseudomonadota bacterium]
MTLFARACRPAFALLFALIALWPAAASAQEKMAACRPVETAVFQNRIHVRCETPVDKRFPFFAVSTVDPRSANRFLSVAETAQVTERFVMVDFDSNDTSGSAFGCGADNCRVARAILLIDEVPSACSIDSSARGCPGFCPSVNNNDISCPGYCD